MSIKSWLSKFSKSCFRHQVRSERRRKRCAAVIVDALVEVLEERAVPAAALSATPADWMSQIADETKLSELSIPGSHDTMTRALALPFVITQYKTLPEQLEGGIRALDIRLTLVIKFNFTTFKNETYLDCYHGAADLFTSFDVVLKETSNFLKAHPGETIVMRVQGDEKAAPDPNSKETVKQAILRYASKYGDIIYRPDAYGFDAVPTLGQARGKLVLFDGGWRSGDTQKSPIISLPFSEIAPGIIRPDGILQDEYDVFDDAKKLEGDLGFMELNNKTRDFSTFHTTYFSGSIFDTSVGIKGPEYFANYMNPSLARFFTKAPAGYYAGIAMMDFVLIDNAFTTDVNEAKLPGLIIDLNNDKRLVSLSAVERGGKMDAGTNLALQKNGGTAFAKDVIPGTTSHSIAKLTDGIYGNANSWIGNTNGSFAGVSLGANPISISSVAWGRDNTGVFKDRVLGKYTLQYTTVPNPNAGTPQSAWKTIGYASPTSSPLRNRYEFAPVLATGIRLLVNDTSDPAKRVAIDELEVYAKPLISQSSPLKLSETGGSATDIKFVSGNLALQQNGGTTFAKDVLSGYSAHRIAHLNDGIYGNNNSWIGNSEGSFVGIKLSGLQVVSSVAFGRDNTGTLKDRSFGQYTIQYTTAASPDASTPDSAWTTIGSVIYSATSPQSPALRHRYDFTSVAATGIRIVISGDASDHVAIDELEAYAVASSNVGVKGVEDGPHIDEGQEFHVPENAATGTVVGTVKVTDPNTSTFKFSLDRNPDNAFAINETTGEITVVSGATLDFENANLFVVGVTVLEVFVDDGSGFGVPAGTPLSATQNVTVRVTNVNESPALNIVGGQANFKSSDRKPVAVLPQIAVEDGDGSAGLGGGTLEITLDVFSIVVAKKLKQLDILDTGDVSAIGRAFVPKVENGFLTLGIQLNRDVTADAIQRFLQGITFKTSGKGLSTPTRTLTVTLTDLGGLPVTVQQTINVAKK